MLHSLHIDSVEEATSQTTEMSTRPNTAKSHQLQRTSILMHDPTENGTSNAQAIVESL